MIAEIINIMQKYISYRRKPVFTALLVSSLSLHTCCGITATTRKQLLAKVGMMIMFCRQNIKELMVQNIVRTEAQFSEHEPRGPILWLFLYLCINWIWFYQHQVLKSFLELEMTPIRNKREILNAKSAVFKAATLTKVNSKSSTNYDNIYNS